MHDALVAILVLVVLALVWVLPRISNLWLRPRFTLVPLCRAHLYTGDLVVTSDKHVSWHAAIVKVATASPFNHVAMVYVDPVTQLQYIWEVNGTGARMILLEDLLAEGRVNVYARHLRRTGLPTGDTVAGKNDIAIARIVEQTIRSQWKDLFNFDVIMRWGQRMLPLDIFPGACFLKGVESKSALRQRTCAHAIAEMYQAIGVLDFSGTDLDPACVFAKDFMRQPDLDPAVLPITTGSRFGPIMQLSL